MKSVLVAVDIVLWLAVAAAAVMGALNFFPLVFLDAARTEGNMSAPQLAALAGSSCAWAIIPYVIARAWQELVRPLRPEGK